MRVGKYSFAVNNFLERWGDRARSVESCTKLVELAEFWGGRGHPDREIVARCVVTILLSAGVTEAQINETDIEVLMESAIALYCKDRGHPSKYVVCDTWQLADRRLADVSFIEDTVLPVPPTADSVHREIANRIDHVASLIDLLTSQGLDFTADQPEWGHAPGSCRPNSYQPEAVEDHMNKHMAEFGTCCKNIKYNIARLAELGFSVPDEWVEFDPLRCARFDENHWRIDWYTQRVDQYQAIARQMNSIARRLRHESVAKNSGGKAPQPNGASDTNSTALPGQAEFPPAVIAEADADAVRPHEPAIANTTVGGFLANAYGDNSAGAIVTGDAPAHPVAPCSLVEQLNESHATAMFAVFTLRIVRKILPGDEPTLFNGMVNSDSPNIPRLAFRIIRICRDVKRQLNGELKLRPAAQDRFALATGSYTVSFGPFKNRASAHDIAYEIAGNLAGICDRGTSVVEEWLAEYHAGDRVLDDYIFAAIDTQLLETALKKEIAVVRRPFGVDAYVTDGAIAQISGGAAGDGLLFAANAAAKETDFPAGSTDVPESSEHPTLQKGGRPQTWTLVHECLDAIVGGGDDWDDQQRRKWARKYNEEYQKLGGFRTLSPTKLGEIIRDRRKKSKRDDD